MTCVELSCKQSTHCILHGWLPAQLLNAPQSSAAGLHTLHSVHTLLLLDWPSCDATLSEMMFCLICLSPLTQVRPQGRGVEGTGKAG